MKVTHLQQAGTIEEIQLGITVVPFTNDGEHHNSIMEIKPESQMLALFDKEIIIILKNYVCDIKPVTMSIKNHIITDISANMAASRNMAISNICITDRNMNILNIALSHVTDFCQLFMKEVRATTCFENLCYQNMQVTTCGRSFPDMPMNTLDQQFFQHQLNASNIDLLFETIDEFEDLLTTPRNTATGRLNPHTDLTSLLITLQYTSGKRPPTPILCTVHDTFWLFSPAAGGSCIYDTNHSFDEVIGPLTG
ncbi:MAG: hypothetical protein EZS28_004204 [Streblomastix strix]|uniref:Uncharacterized protein n=1 Tax=Streblomastix strix TaxID=222440 RepID=A0A5J4WYS0_9EUKA|nr:MAG: hypothetical protein EZS28_004204 [Streblomastix strix]